MVKVSIGFGAGRGGWKEAVSWVLEAERLGVDSVWSAENSSPRARPLRREFSPARPPGLGGGHCALGLVDAVAHEPCGGSPVQGYKG